jgi:hypothetical protein
MTEMTGSHDRPHVEPRFHFITMVLALWLLGGVFIDGWAHINVAGTKETFFTPWHGVLYSWFAATALWITLPAVRGVAGDSAIAFPTDTAWGLWGSACSFSAGSGTRCGTPSWGSRPGSTHCSVSPTSCC